ncbi:MAG: hypothetical protein ACI9SC_000093 [Gammaproteobacteria bacterium]|jgi:hypothetical protein
MLDITLYIPGLFDSEIMMDDDHHHPDLSALEYLLARGQKITIQSASHNADLCHLFNYVPAEDEDIPMAAIGRLIDDEKRPEGYWMRADPVHLLADQKSLSLLDASNLSLTQHDALALAACVQQSFTELGWVLEVPVPTRWYVKLNRKPSIRTSDLQMVTGSDIQQHMPMGEDAAIWHRLMNEIQMQFHSADINQLRVERGELPVNSLWLWGTGALPDLQERRWSRVFSDDVNTMGLSMLSNTPCLPLPELAENLFSEESKTANVLVVMSEFQSTFLQHEQRQEQLDKLENTWCKYLLQKLHEGDLRSLRIITGSWQFTIKRYSLMKFWLRVKTFNSYIQ